MFSDYFKVLLHYLLPKNTLTTLAGLLAHVKNPFIKNAMIRCFIAKYQVNLSEAEEENYQNYEDFNAFFIRKLKPTCRPIAQCDIVSPVDGYLSESGLIQSHSLLQAKGRYYGLEELFAGDKERALQFSNGLYATLYLSPKDYHRVHMPIDAVLKEMIYVPGQLFSVQPMTTRVIPKLFARNERVIVFFETSVGLMAMVLVGATIVGAIGTTWQGDIKRSKIQTRTTFPTTLEEKTSFLQGEEMGYFKLGSTVILLFADSKQVHWVPGLQAGSPIQYGNPFGIIE